MWFRRTLCRRIFAAALAGVCLGAFAAQAAEPLAAAAGALPSTKAHSGALTNGAAPFDCVAAVSAAKTASRAAPAPRLARTVAAGAEHGLPARVWHTAAAARGTANVSRTRTNFPFKLLN